MANLEQKCTEVAFISIWTVNSAGDRVSAIAGDTFSVVSSDPTKAVMTIDVMPSGPDAGSAAVKSVPMVRSAPGLTATVTDTDNLTTDVQIIDIVDDTLTPAAISLDVTHAVFVPQPAPTA